MIESHWPRIAAMHVQDDGSISCVWVAQDKDANCLHLYDAHTFRREVLAVISDGIKARGKWVPVAWHEEAKDISEKLLERGCNMIPEPVKNSDPIAEVVSREIEEKMRSGRFKVASNLNDWIEEFRTFYRQDSKVPRDTHPLMAATRHAVAMLDYARRQSTQKGANYPRLAMV